MKKILTLIALAITLITAAQAPQGFNYQATVRNNSGQLLLNQSVLVNFNILQNSDAGPVVYSENQTANTDDLGHINLVVGQGTATTGTFASINWANGTYYLGIELNTGGGYVAMGTTQLLSVPYAMHANTATSTTGNSGGFTHYIGEAFGGGVIFHLWKDALGVEHGLIVDKTDFSAAQQVWSNIDQTLIGPSAQSSWDGLSNSNAIVGQAGHTNSAAALCLNSINGGQSDWYLPSIDELERLYQNRLEVNSSLRSSSGTTELKRVDINGDAFYWSSTENGNYNAWGFDFANGGANGYPNKNTFTFYVRAVRAF